MMLLLHSNLDYKSVLPWTSEHFCLLSCLICAWRKEESYLIAFFLFSYATQTAWNRRNSEKEQPGSESKARQHGSNQ